MLNMSGQKLDEVAVRLHRTTYMLQELNQFWKGSDCTARFKRVVFHTVIIISKTLYVLESAELPQSALDNSDGRFLYDLSSR